MAGGRPGRFLSSKGTFDLDVESCGLGDQDLRGKPRPVWTHAWRALMRYGVARFGWAELERRGMHEERWGQVVADKVGSGKNSLGER